MKPGDLVEWNRGKYIQRGIVIRASSFFGWVVYFPEKNQFEHVGEAALKKIQETS